jgi:hypothetical protein
VIRQLGLWDAVASRLRPAPNGATAMKALAASERGAPDRLHPGKRDPRDTRDRAGGSAAAGLRSHDDLYGGRHDDGAGAGRRPELIARLGAP